MHNLVQVPHPSSWPSQSAHLDCCKSHLVCHQLKIDFSTYLFPMMILTLSFAACLFTMPMLWGVISIFATVSPIQMDGFINNLWESGKIWLVVVPPAMQPTSSLAHNKIQCSCHLKWLWLLFLGYCSWHHLPSFYNLLPCV